MKLSEKFMKHASLYHNTYDYNPEWNEISHFSTRPENCIFYSGHTEDGYHRFLVSLTRKKRCENMYIDVRFDENIGEYVGIKKILKRPLKDEEVAEFIELVTSYFIRLAKHGYLINQYLP